MLEWPKSCCRLNASPPFLMNFVQVCAQRGCPLTPGVPLGKLWTVTRGYSSVVERTPDKREVEGSIPSSPTTSSRAPVGT